MRLGPVSQLHGAQRYSMSPNPLDVDPEQTRDLLALEESPSHRQVLADYLRNLPWELRAGGIVPAHSEPPWGRRRARGAAPGVGTPRTCTFAFASPRVATIPDAATPPR